MSEELDQAAVALADAVRNRRGRFQTVKWWRAHCPDTVKAIVGVKRITEKRYQPVFQHALDNGLLQVVKVGSFDTVQPGPNKTIDRPDEVDILDVFEAPEAPEPDPPKSEKSKKSKNPEPTPAHKAPPKPEKSKKSKKPDPARINRPKRSQYETLRLARAREIPVPKGSVRTMAKHERSMGWPGMCTDEDGFYIGGLGNDCRRYRPKGSKLCAVHKALSKRRRRYDEDEDQIE